MSEQVKWSELVHFTDKQKEADKASDDFKFTLYGGAMGGGKSYWLRWKLLKLLLKWGKEGHKNVTVGLFCEDYPALKDRHLSKVKFEFPDWFGIYNSTDHNFVLNQEFGSGVLAFRNLDDASKYQSSEFAAIGVDEITKNKREVFDFLRTRLRWPGIKNVKFIGATNPGGIGHDWVKQLWLNRQYDSNEKEQDQFVYIQAKAKDNPHLDPNYVNSLQGLPEDMRKAFLEGDWDIFKGQYFKEWRRDLHVVAPFDVMPFHRKFIMGDYGYAAPSAVYWGFKDSDGVLYLYRELYKTGLTYEQLIREIIALTPKNEVIDFMVFDPAIWAKKGESELSGAEIMETVHRQITGKLPNMIKGNKDRINGWNIMRDYLKPFYRNGKTIAKLQVFPQCENLIRTLPSLVYDKIKVEDCDTNGEDHAPDSVRYGIMVNSPNSPKMQTATETMLNRRGRPDFKVISFE